MWETTERARSGYFSGTATPPVDRPSWNPNFTGKVINKGVTQYYNPNAFILQPVGTLGTVGRDSLYGPGYSALDFAVQKRMTMRALGDNRYIQLRAELFNILNHPNFANPILPAFIADPASNININCGCGFAPPSNGREVGNGAYQITATGDVGIGNPFLGGGGPRGIQLAAKFTF